MWIRMHIIMYILGETAAQRPLDPSCSVPLTLSLPGSSRNAQLSQGDPSDPGHCAHKIQKLAKQNTQTAAQAATFAGSCLS